MQHVAFATMTALVCGVLTTEHSASSYGMPVFVADANESQRFAGQIISPADGAIISLGLDIDHYDDDVGAMILAAARCAGYATEAS